MITSIKTNGLALGAVVFSLTVPAAFGALPGPTVSPAWLAQHLHDRHLLVLDLRTPEQYAQGHIPGAVSAPYAQWRQTIRNVNRMLPPVPVIQAYLRHAGLNQTSEVVLYTAVKTPMALGLGAETRAFWTLAVLGHRAQAILPTGYEGWVAAKQPVAQSAARVTRGNFVAHLQPQYLATRASVQRDLATHRATLVDDRPMSQIVGLSKAPFVSSYGHIPGALAYPANWLVNPEGVLVQRDQLVRLAQLSRVPQNRAAPVVTYCNTGHWASIGWFTMTQELGYRNVRLYDGSMTQWAHHKHDPIAVGFVR